MGKKEKSNVIDSYDLAARPIASAPPLLTLLNRRNPQDCYGWDRIDVIAFNIDGAGECLVRVYADHCPHGVLQTMRGDMQNVLDDGLYAEPPPDWDGKTLPVPKKHEYVDYCFEHWGRHYYPKDSAAHRFFSSKDVLEEQAHDEATTELFDAALDIADLPPRPGKSCPYVYKYHAPEDSEARAMLDEAYETAKRGEFKFCVKLLLEIRQQWFSEELYEEGDEIWFTNPSSDDAEEDA